LAVREWATLASEFDQTLEDVLASIGERPESYSPAPDAPPGVEARQASVGRFPYRFVFVLRADSVFVLAFAHKRQRPGFWRERLR
jgi:plasmid stabilization system protein ParE